VKPGQALIELSSPQVGQLQADAQKTTQDMLIAQKTVDRVHKLKIDGAVSEKEVAQAEADLQKAKADVGRAGAQLRSIGISASDPAVAVTIRAQIAGTVVERNVLVGQEVRADATTPLMTVTNLEALWVIADVYEQDLGLITSGATVSVTVPAYPGETFPGTVARLGDVVDPTSRTVKLRCVVPNPEGKLKPEMFAKIAIAETSGKQVIVIPAKSVLNEAGKFRVIVVENNTFHPVFVEVGPESSGKVRVLSGLKPGDRVVTDGALFLKHDIDTK
jgi:cobalt-zinc-cadmium efflux system membrane fusion protein